MRAEFKRKVSMRCFDSYMVVGITTERKDIQVYLENIRNGSLNGYGESKPIFTYLQNIGLLDKNNSISNKGYELLHTGKMLHQEEGKYRVWCIVDDELIGNRVLHMKRELQDKKDEHLENLNYISGLRKNQEVVSRDKNMEIVENVLILEFNKDNNAQEIDTEYIELIWNWSSHKESKYCLNGKINYQNNISRENYKIDLNNHKFDYELNTETFIETLRLNYCDWDSNLERVKVQFSSSKAKEIVSFPLPRERGLHNFFRSLASRGLGGNSEKSFEEVYLSFKLPYIDLQTSSFSKGEFDSARLYDIDVMPKDNESAISWRNYLIEYELKKDYMTEEKFTNFVLEQNKRDVFLPYNLEPLEIRGYIEQMKIDRIEKLDTYFHLSAPYDLNPYTESVNKI